MFSRTRSDGTNSSELIPTKDEAIIKRPVFHLARQLFRSPWNWLLNIWPTRKSIQWPSSTLVGESLSERVQPDDMPAYLDRLVPELRNRSQRDTHARLC